MSVRLSRGALAAASFFACVAGCTGGSSVARAPATTGAGSSPTAAPTSSAAPAAPAWALEQAGLEGGEVLALARAASAPSAFYLSVTGGVHRSDDGGATWSRCTGPADADARALAVDPRQANVVFAGTDDGVRRSLDGGAHWSLVGLAGVKVASLAIDPTRPARLFAGVDHGQGLFVSTDGGATWTERSRGLATAANPTDTQTIGALAIDPRTPDTIYAADSWISGCGVRKSDDAGATWSQTGLLASPSLGPSVHALALDPLDPRIVYAGTSAGLFRSTDGAATWGLVPAPFTEAGGVAFDPRAPRTLWVTTFAGTFRSGDGGATWTGTAPWSAVDLPTGPILVTPAGRLLVGCFATLLSSTDDGATWRRRCPGVALPSVQALAVHPARPRTVLAGTYGWGIARSDDAGVTWSPTGLVEASVTALALDPTDPRTVYAGVAGDLVMKSTDDGRTFFPASAGLPTQYVRSIAVDGRDPRTVYAALEAVWVSRDAAATWSLAPMGTVSFPLRIASAPGSATVFVGDYTGVSSTSDGGRTWSVVPGLPSEAFPGLAIDPTAPDRVLASGAGVWRSLDGGRTWTRTRALDASAIVAAPQAVYATVWDPFGASDLVDRSDDGGATWLPAGAGIPRSAHVQGLAVDPSDARTVWAATGHGLYRTTTGGR